MFIHIAEGSNTPRFVLYKSEHELWDEPQTYLDIRANSRQEAYKLAQEYAAINKCELCKTCCYEHEK